MHEQETYKLEPIYSGKRCSPRIQHEMVYVWVSEYKRIESVSAETRTQMVENWLGPHPSRTVNHALHRSEVTFLNLDDEVLPEVLAVFVYDTSSFEDPIEIGEQFATCGFRLLHVSTNHDEG